MMLRRAFFACSLCILTAVVWSTPKVLPPSPDDEVIPCTNSCEPERFCEPIPGDDETTLCCLHKTLLPLTLRDILAFVIALTCCFVAAMAGIGGGGLVLPLLVLLQNFTPKEASVVSNSAVFGNCVGQGLVNVFHRKEINRHVVLGTVLMVLPGLFAGGSAAIALEGVVPSTVILMLAVTTLALATAKTLRKAKIMRKDLQNLQTEVIVDSSSEEQTTPSYHSCSSSEDQNEEGARGSESVGASLEIQSMGENIIDEDADDTDDGDYSIQTLIGLSWAVNVVSFLTLHGSLGFHVKACSPGYFFVIFAPAIFAFFFIWRGRVELRKRRSQWSGETNREYTLRTPLLSQIEDDVVEENFVAQSSMTEIAPKQFELLTWWLPLAAAFVGLLAALLGIGGSELVGPVLLLLNMDPRYSSTTTAILSLLNSGTNAIHHSLAGLVVAPAYCLLFGCVGLFGGGPGRTVAIHIAGRGGGTSVIAFSLVAVLSVAAVLVLYELLSTPPSWGSERLCK